MNRGKDNGGDMGNKMTPHHWGKGFDPLVWSHATFGEASSIEEYAFLFGLAALIRPRNILEVGTSTGLGAIAMLLGAGMTGIASSVLSIDKKRYAFEKNMALFGVPMDRVEFVQGESFDILSRIVKEKRRFDLCLIDGGHDYETVSNDWNLARHLSTFFIFHDCQSEPGVKKVVSEIESTMPHAILSLTYPPGHQVDDPTREWYQTLTTPGFCIVHLKNAI